MTDDRYRLSAIGYRLSAVGYRLSAVGYRLSAVGYRLSAIGYRLSAVRCPLSAGGYRLSAIRCPLAVCPKEEGRQRGHYKTCGEAATTTLGPKAVAPLSEAVHNPSTQPAAEPRPFAPSGRIL